MANQPVSPCCQNESANPKSYEIGADKVLDYRFQITELISQSGMGTIFKAIDRNTGRTVAIKIPHLSAESDPGFYQRFEREEKIGLALDHPGIMHVIAVEKKSRPYLVMEYLDGQTLRQRLSSGSMDLDEAVRFAMRICDVLDYMHSHKVIHRDLKPENIMLCVDGSIRIIDFGIAKVAGHRRLTFGGFTHALGTPDYIAPEQVKGKRGDERTDIYSFGAMLYEMTTGSAPFNGESPYQIMNARLSSDPAAPHKRNPAISAQLEEIILHAMERDPSDRFSRAADMKRELEAPETVELTGRKDRLQPLSQWRMRWRSMRVAVWTMLITLAICGSALFIYRRH
jgi:serine/threonine-protein kinase